MKRHDDLFDRIVDMENIYTAYENAREHRHFKNEIMACSRHLENELGELRFNLLVGEWEPGGFYQFESRTEVKRRIINAPKFLDRVVHHAIIQVIMPLFERKFIYDSYACRLKPKRYFNEAAFQFERRKKGTHRAVKRLQKFIRSTEDMSRTGKAYVLQCDISKYYLTIDHDILKKEIRRNIADKRLLEVWDKIIDGYHEPVNQTIREIWARKGLKGNEEKTNKGVPIGALTSQLMANIYLNPLDHFVKEILHAKHYLRYMDDFLIVAPTKQELWEHLSAIRWFVEERLNLVLNPKTKVFPVSRGVDFAGYRTFRDYLLPRKRNIKAAKIRFKDLSHKFRHGEAGFEDVKPRVGSFLGYVKHCKASETTDSTLAYLVLSKSKGETEDE